MAEVNELRKKVQRLVEAFKAGRIAKNSYYHR